MRKTQKDTVLVPSAHLVCHLSLLGIASLGLDGKIAKRTETVQACADHCACWSWSGATPHPTAHTLLLRGPGQSV